MSAYDLILQGKFIANNSSTYFNEAYDIKERNISKQLYVETVLKEHFLDDKTFSNYKAAPEVRPLLAHVSYMLELNKWKEHCKSQVVEPVKRPEKSHTSRSLVASTTATAPLAPLTSAKSAAPVAVAPLSAVSSPITTPTSGASSSTPVATSASVSTSLASIPAPTVHKATIKDVQDNTSKGVNVILEKRHTLLRDTPAKVDGQEIPVNCLNNILSKKPVIKRQCNDISWKGKKGSTITQQ